MTDWQISIPYRDRRDPVAAIGDAAGAIPGREEREVVRALALELVMEPNIATVGDALDAMESADPAARRALLDRARERAGLPSTGRAEAIEAYEVANRAIASSAPIRDAQGRVQALCAHPGCSNFEPGDLPGQIALVAVRRWWCTQHAHLAKPGDSEPYSPRLAFNSVGLIVDLDELDAERERAQVEAESRRRRREAREAERAVEAVEHERFVQAERERYRRESPAGTP